MLLTGFCKALIMDRLKTLNLRVLLENSWWFWKEFSVRSKNTEVTFNG